MVADGATNSAQRSDDRATSPADLPNPRENLPEIVIYSHSSLLYWWPVWTIGFILAAWSYAFGQPFSVDVGRIEWISSSPGVGVTFMIVLLLVIIFTNARLRGIYSVTAITALALLVAGLGWFGVLDDLFAAIPHLSIFLSAGFYLIFSTALLIIWALAFFVFDRVTYWRVRPGQMTRENWIGGGAESFDTRGMMFEKHAEDYFRHNMLGLGAGDLRLKTAGANKQDIDIPNVIFVDRKVDAIQRLIMVEPDSLMS